MVDQVLFNPDVPPKQASDEMVRKLVAIVKSARHLLLSDDQDRTSCKCGGGRRAVRLTCHAFRTEVGSAMQNREDRLLAPLRLNREFHMTLLDVEHFLASVAL